MQMSSSLCIFRAFVRLPALSWIDTNTGNSFTGQVKLHSILIRTSNSSSAPQTLKVFINRDDLDFSTASDLAPTQQFELSQTSEIQDIAVKRALFGKVQSLTLFVEDNHGEDVSRLSYLGFKGDWMQLGRAPTNIIYEAAANPNDHTIKGTSVNQMESSLGGRGYGMWGRGERERCMIMRIWLTTGYENHQKVALLGLVYFAGPNIIGLGRLEDIKIQGGTALQL